MRKKEVKKIALIALVSFIILFLIFSLILSFAKVSEAGDSSVLFSLSVFSKFFQFPLPISPETTRCSDHIDNNGDGFCGYKTNIAYCIDGSMVGDLGCLGISDNEES